MVQHHIIKVPDVDYMQLTKVQEELFQDTWCKGIRQAEEFQAKGDSDMKMTVVFMYLVRAEPTPNSWWVSLYSQIYLHSFSLPFFSIIITPSHHPCIHLHTSQLLFLSYLSDRSNPTLKLPSFILLLAF